MLRQPRLVPLVLLALLGVTACDDGSNLTDLDVQYHSSSQRIRVLVSRDLQSGETLHARLRSGEIGQLDCLSQAASIDRIDGARVASEASPTFEGPTMTPDQFDSPYNSTAWLEMEPTAEMLAAIADGQLIIEVCLMGSDGSVVREAEFDARRALDRRGLNGKFDGEEARIASTVAYAEACVDALGEIPFFPAIGEGDYETYNCLDSTPIPTTITGPSGTVSYPATQVNECDNPQYIYSLCEPSAQGPDGVRPDINGPRVTSASNEQGTHWVLLCRKSRPEVGQYNDVAMIGHNPYTGRTCFFQNALYSRTDGVHVPHPGDKVQSDRSPQQSSSLWEGIHGGVGSGIECAECHATDPFIHTPWIDGAQDQNGDPVVPRMGISEDFSLGYNEAPYSIVNMDGQGWTIPQQLTSPEAAACTRCHRVANDRWSNNWINRMVGEDTAWTNITSESYRDFQHTFWMPPELDGLDETTFWDSDYGHSIRFIQNCARNPSDAACRWEPIPRDSEGTDGALPTVDLTGPALATAALRILGASIESPDCEGGNCATRRCAECHSVSRPGLRRWLEYTDHAWNTCGITEGRQSVAEAVLAFVNSADQSVLDNEVGLRSDVSQAIVAGRPYSTLDALDAVPGVGPATIADIQEYAANDPVHMTQEEAVRAIDCLRVDPNDANSVFSAEALGVHTTGVQYGYFRRLFRTAYGDDWLIPYNRFKSRVSMPKGSHPALSQMEYATLLAWFRNDLNDLETVLQEAPPPSTCTDGLNATAISSHLGTMQFEGWGAVNEDAGIRMFGCSGADPLTCFSTGYNDVSSTWGNGTGVMRQLRELGFRSSFWMRSSADGRFVGNGGGNGVRSTITDLLNMRDVGIAASYDPGFFPDNSGFMFQGTSGGAGICTQGVLDSGDPIDFTETGCTTARGINLYQHVARGLSGGDYFVINSQFTSDSARSAQSDPSANFNASSTMKFTPMIFDGTTYQAQDPIIVDSPYEGDSVLSPSSQLVASRLAGPEGRSLGYVIRRVNATRFGDTYRITLSDPPLATVCMSGAKPNFSFDERFIVTHTHTGDVSNVWLVDLTTGERTQITNMPPNHRALFPHFRSDGWFYFLVMDNDTNREYVVASDAALVIAAR